MVQPPVPTTIGEQCLEAAVAALATALDPVLVFNQRVRPFEEGELPAVNVKMGHEIVTYIGPVQRKSQGVYRDLQMIVRMEAPGDPPALDPMRRLAIKALMADRSLGGLAVNVSEVESEWEYEAASDATYGVLATMFEIRYATAADDATVQLGN